MGKLLRPFVVLAAITGVMAVASVPSAPAQVKKDDKTKADEVGVTEVYMAKDGWRIRIKNTQGKSMAIGTVGFEKKEDALKAVDMIKTALTKGKVVEIKDPPKK